MDSAKPKPDRNLIISLKLQDKYLKKWGKESGLAEKKYLRPRTKKKAFYFSEVSDKKTDVQKLQDDIYEKRKKSKCYDLIEKTTLELRKEIRLNNQFQPLHKKDTQQTRIKTKIRGRLEVEVPDIPIKTKTDIDPGFFTTIEGRPTKRYFQRREYLKKQTELLVTRASILQINNNIESLKECSYGNENILNEVIKSFPFHETQSKNYVYKDFDITAEMHSREKEARLTRINFFQKRKQLLDKVQRVRCNLYNLEETWRTLKAYQSFLYRVSPLSWRQEFDTIHVCEDKFNLISPSESYEKYIYGPEGPTPSLEELLQLFYEVSEHEDSPVMFFETPKQLKNYFDFILELNANTYHRSMMLDDDCRILDRFLRELKNSVRKELEKIKNEHNDFIESVLWLENRKTELNYAVKIEIDNTKEKILSETHIGVEAKITEAYNVLLKSGKFKVGLKTILKQLSADVSRVLLEVNELPPVLVKRLISKQENDLAKIEQAGKDFKKLQRLKKRIKDSIFHRIIPKHCKSIRPRSSLPVTKEKEKLKVEVETKDDLYIEDIFKGRLEYQQESDLKIDEILPEIVTEEIVSSRPEGDYISKEMDETDSLPKTYTLTLSKQPSTPKSFESLTSTGLESETKIPIPEYPTETVPNKTIDLPMIDVKIYPPRRSSKAIKKPSPIITELTKRKISLLTNYDKSYSVGETDHEVREISFIDIVKTTRIKDNIMRWKSIFPSEKEKISKSSLFHKEITTPDPYLYSVKQKIRDTSKTWYMLKSDLTNTAPFLSSSYIPSLPSIPETDIATEGYTEPLDPVLPTLDKRLREFKIKYYSHKYSFAAIKQ